MGGVAIAVGVLTVVLWLCLLRMRVCGARDHAMCRSCLGMVLFNWHWVYWLDGAEWSNHVWTNDEQLYKLVTTGEVYDGAC